MKYLLAIIYISTICIGMSCTSKPERPESVLTADRIAAADAAATQNANVLAAKGTVQHYYCANNCPGSGGDAAGTCPTCGSEYTHNQAWHNQTQTQNQTPNTLSTTTTTNIEDVSTGIVPPGQAAPEPAQNAAGVWHYTCPNGHAGGAGSAVACSECSTTLVHNTLYHQ